ncbi:MAG TPA: mechanosensitive ion channel [bacterium]|nr:mechanosensitive ion channel [bacterium]
MNFLEPWLQNVWTWVEDNGLQLLTLLVLGFMAQLFLRTMIKPRMFTYRTVKDVLQRHEQEKRAQTITAVFRGTGSFFIWLIIILFMFKQVGIGVGNLVAGIGIAGIAIGLGAQSLVKDMIAGFFVIFENHYNIGDVISVAGVSGRVEEINLRTTILRDLEGAVHIVPNGQISIVTNKTKQWAQVVLDMPIAPDEDIDRAMRVIQRVGRELVANKRYKSALLSAPKVLGVNEVSKNQIVIRSLVKTHPDQRWAIERIMRKKIKQEFDKEGIKTVGT